ncbi:MAG TPA: hypothetical protein VIP80_13325 [Gemmatimonadales bacterium]|jgi:hypothetical protein
MMILNGGGSVRGRRSLILLTSSLCLAPVASAQSSAAAEVLTNQTVIQMVTAKLGTDVIQAKIQSTKTNFDVTTSGLVSLYTNKVPREILKTMLAVGSGKGASEVLTNQSVIQMVTAKLPRDVILAKIQSSKTKFDVTSDGLVSLNTNKVPKDIIKAMMVAGPG